MRFILDNNLSPAYARALAALCEPDGIIVEHLRQKFPQDIQDTAWISALSKEVGWSILTQDRLIKNPLEKEALRVSGLTAFILARTWNHHKYWEKAAQLVRWWPRILEQAELVQPGAAFEIPWKFAGKGKLKALRL